MAFVASIVRASCSPKATCSNNKSSTRREALQAAATAAAALTTVALFPQTAKAADLPGLPPGAKQFSQVITSQKQWTSLKMAFADGRAPDSDEWKNVRTYLRQVYAVSGDMDFLVRGWDQQRRDAGQVVIRRFRKEVKALDKPAIGGDVDAFLKGHAEVAHLYDDFLGLLKQDSVGDMPSEL